MEEIAIYRYSSDSPRPHQSTSQEDGGKRTRGDGFPLTVAGARRSGERLEWSFELRASRPKGEVVIGTAAAVLCGFIECGRAGRPALEAQAAGWLAGCYVQAAGFRPLRVQAAGVRRQPAQLGCYGAEKFQKAAVSGARRLAVPRAPASSRPGPGRDGTGRAEAEAVRGLGRSPPQGL